MVAYEKLLNEIYAAVSLKYLWKEYQPYFIKSESPDWIDQLLGVVHQAKGAPYGKALLDEGKLAGFLTFFGPWELSLIHI